MVPPTTLQCTVTFGPAAVPTEDDLGDVLSKPAYPGTAALARAVHGHLAPPGRGTRHEPYAGLLGKLGNGRLPTLGLLSYDMIGNNHRPVTTSWEIIKNNQHWDELLVTGPQTTVPVLGQIHLLQTLVCVRCHKESIKFV